MAEKGEAPSDQVSLPPTYAPSETFTDSPPPAYRGPTQAAVKIVKLICMTVFFLTVFLCLFFLGYKYLHNQGLQQVDNFRYEDSVAGETAPLIAKAGVANLDLNNNVIEEFVEAKEQQRLEKERQEFDMDEAAKEEEEEVNNEVQAIQDGFMKEEKPSLPINPFDLMLGKKPMMGGNVKCKVQKRKQKIGDDVIAQAVIVKCDDEEEEGGENMPNGRPLGPPLSILGNIMKALALKASKPQFEEPKIKKISIRPMTIPLYPGDQPEMMGMNGPIRPMPGPFNGPPRRLVHFIPLNKINEPRPFEPAGPPLPPLPPFMERQRGPPPHFKKFNFIPLNKIEEPRIEPFAETNELPPPFFTPRREEEFPQPRPFLNIIPLRKIVERQRPEFIGDQNELPPHMINPQMGPIPFIRPLKIIREPLAPEVEHEHELPPPHMMEDHHHGPMPGPFPFPPQSRPIKIIRLIKKGNEIEEFPEMDGPFPPNPILKLIPRQPRRIIHLRREPTDEMPPFPIRGAFPLPRGALPMEPLVRESHFNSLPVPEAKPRGFEKPFRIPLPPIDMQPLPEVQVSTHMEMRHPGPPPPFPIEAPLPLPFPPQEIHPQEESLDYQTEELEEFGPPKTHTVIEAAPPPYFEEEQQHPIILPPPPFMRQEELQNDEHVHFPEQDFLGQPPPPPPPSFDPEGRFSPVAEIEPDAEMVDDTVQIVQAEPVIPPQEMVPLEDSEQ